MDFFRKAIPQSAEPAKPAVRGAQPAKAAGGPDEARRALQRDRMLRDLGELCLKAHREGAGVTRAMQRKLRELSLFEAGGQAPEQYADVEVPEGKRPCSCGAQVVTSALFCHICGVPIDGRAAKVPSCAGCGARIQPQRRLCEPCELKETASRRRLVRHPLTGQEMAVDMPSDAAAPSVAQSPPPPDVAQSPVPGAPASGPARGWRETLQQYAQPASVDLDQVASRGRELIQVGRYREATAAFESVVAGSPRDSRAYYHLGVARYKTGDLDGAMESFLKASRLDRHNPDVYNDLGLCYKSKGQTREARDCYLEALQIAPAHSDAHYNLAQIYRQQGRIPDAVAHFRLYLQYSPRARDFQQVAELIEVLSRGGGR